MRHTLLSKTRGLLKRDKRTIEQLARDSGLPLPWLATMRAGTCKSPGVQRTQELFEFLSGRKLKV